MILRLLRSLITGQRGAKDGDKMKAFLSRRTGKSYGSEEEYIEAEISPAFKRIRKYSQINLGSDLFNKVKDADTLVDAIKEATKNASELFLKDLEKTEDYKILVENNMKTQIKAEYKIPKSQVIVAQPHTRTYYSRLSKRDLISRRTALRRELKEIERQLKARGRRIR